MTRDTAHRDVRSILFFVKRFHPSIGGVERYVGALGEALAADGREVSVVTSDESGRLPRRERVGAIDVYRFPSARSPLRAWARLVRLVPLFRAADVVHVSDVEMLEYYHRMIGWLVGPRALTLTRHGISARDPVPDAERLRSRRAREWVDALFDDGYFIEKRLGTQPDAVPDQGLAPTADQIEQKPEPRPESAIFIGRLDTDTGIDIYLDTLAALRDRHAVHLRLTVYAAGPLEAAMRARAVRQRLAVTWNPPHPDARERIGDHALAFVSGRMAIHEAMARRRVVVAAYVDPIKRDYVCGEPFSPHIVSGCRAEQLAEAVAGLIVGHAERARLVERAFAHVRTLSWAATAETYLSQWRAMLAASSRRTDLITRRGLLSFAMQLRREAGGAEPRMVTPGSAGRSLRASRLGTESGMCMR